MMRLVSLLACLVAVAFAGHVVELTSENFEVQTQIGSGAMTGDWLICFYAPWCGHCKKMTQEWENFAQSQHDAMTKGFIDSPVANIGNVNCDEHRDICQRFDVKGYPTITFFKNGMMYDYMGPRTAVEFENFIDGGYKKATQNLAPPPGVAHRGFRVWKAFRDDLKALAMDVENLFTDHSLACLSILVAGFITGLIVSTVIILSAQSNGLSVDKAKVN